MAGAARKTRVFPVLAQTVDSGGLLLLRGRFLELRSAFLAADLDGLAANLHLDGGSRLQRVVAGGAGFLGHVSLLVTLVSGCGQENIRDEPGLSKSLATLRAELGGRDAVGLFERRGE